MQQNEKREGRENPPFALGRIRQCREGADRHDRWVGIGLDRPTSKPSRRVLGRGFDDLAISDVEDAVSDGRNPSVVGDHDDGLLEISVQRLEQIQDFLARLRVEFARGLVREEQGRIVRQGNRDGDPLLLAAAHLVRPMARTVGEADEVEEFLRPSLPGRAVFGGEAHRQLDVFLGGERRDEVEELEDEARLAQSISDELSVAHVDQVGAVHLDPTRGRAVDSAKDIQERRLAASRRPSNRDEFAVVDVQAEAAQGDDFRFPRSIHFDQVLGQDLWHVYPPRSLRTRPMSIRATRRETRKDVTSIANGAAARSRRDTTGLLRNGGRRLSPDPEPKVMERYAERTPTPAPTTSPTSMIDDASPINRPAVCHPLAPRARMDANSTSLSRVAAKRMSLRPAVRMPTMTRISRSMNPDN